MNGWRIALRGTDGHPLHPPLTDVTVGALTVGTFASVGGWWGLYSDLLAPTAHVATLIGLVVAVPTAITGLADLLALPVDSPARSKAIAHLAVMVTAVCVYLVAFLLLSPGGPVPASAAVTSALALVLLGLGGWLGGALVFGHGVRVDSRPGDGSAHGTADG